MKEIKYQQKHVHQLVEAIRGDWGGSVVHLKSLYAFSVTKQATRP